MAVELARSVAEAVYAELGAGHSEAVYQCACEAELRLRGVSYSAQVVAPVFYKGVSVGHVRADIVVSLGEQNDRWAWELKATVAASGSVLDAAVQQAAAYVRWLNLCGGVVIHFPTVQHAKSAVTVREA